MAAVDEDLWHGAKAACALNHVRALVGIEADIDLLVVEALGAQQILCRTAIAAELGGVEENARHNSLPLKCSKIISTMVTGRLTGAMQGFLCAQSKAGRRQARRLWRAPAHPPAQPLPASVPGRRRRPLLR